MYRFSFSVSSSTCLGPFIVVLGGMNYIAAASLHDMAPQLIWLVECFIVATTYFLSKSLPNDRLMCMWLVTNCCMVHSSGKKILPLSESPMAMTSGKVQSVFLHHWCQVRLSCRPLGLQSKYFTGTSRNSAGTYCCTF